MSLEALAWARKQTTGDGTTKLILLLLADQASHGPDDPEPGRDRPANTDQRHYTFAGQAHIAAGAEVAVATVRRHEKRLVELGLIRKYARFNRAGNRTSDWIVLAVDNTGPCPFTTDDHRAEPTTGQIDLRSTASVGPPLTDERVTVSTEPSGSSTSVSSRSKSVGGTSRGTRSSPAPSSLPITDDMRTWAAREVPGVDVDREHPNFLDHHRSKGTRMIDWVAGWRKWMRNAAYYADQQTKRSGNGQVGYGGHRYAEPPADWCEQADRVVSNWSLSATYPAPEFRVPYVQKAREMIAEARDGRWRIPQSLLDVASDNAR
jgi:hypothetical protein